MDPSSAALHFPTRPGQPMVPHAQPTRTSPARSQQQKSHQPPRHSSLHIVKEYTDEKVDPSFVPTSSSHCSAPRGSLPHICTLSISQPGAPCSRQLCSSHSSHPSHFSHSHSHSLSHNSTSHPYSVSTRTASSPAYTRPRGLRIANLLKPWIPIILYAITSLGFVAAISLWKAEVFEGLDQLAHWLQSDEDVGRAVIFALIFLTTFPPIPLYSTLIILSGYTFGPWTGAIISYFASLAGALTVFILSRAFFRETISRWLSCTITIKRVVRAIEKRPKLLFLIRVAPYPFNVMNCLLAASPTLSLRTYTICTALSLFKLIIHTSIGSSIHSFAEFHVKKPDTDDSSSSLGHYSTIAGIVLTVGIFIYLSYVARKAVDDELGYEAINREETEAFLAHDGDDQDGREMMTELPRTSTSSRPWSREGPVRLDSSNDRFDRAGYEEASIGL